MARARRHKTRKASRVHDRRALDLPLNAEVAAVEIDDPVPPAHFKAVAQVIGYVLRLQGKLPARAG